MSANCFSEYLNPACGWVKMIVPIPCSRSTSGTKVIDRKLPAAAALRVNSGVSGARTSGISMIRRSRIARVEGDRFRSNGIGYTERTRSTSKPEIEAAVAFQCSLLSLTVVIVAEQGSNSFAALLTIASNTGCTSVELAITLRISAVAVWRSSAARSRFVNCAISDLGLLPCRSRDFGLIDLGPVGLVAVDWRLR